MIQTKINLEQLLITLERVKSAVLIGSEKTEKVVCEITVTPHNLTFVVPGASFVVACKSYGVCKASFNFLNFMQIIETFEENELILLFLDGFINIGAFSLPAKTLFSDKIKNYRTIELPINYTDLDLLLLPKVGYSFDEIEFCGLSRKVDNAIDNYSEKLIEAQEILSVYGVHHKDIEALVNNIIDKKTKLLKEILNL